MHPPATALRHDLQRKAEAAMQLALDRIVGTVGARPRRVILDWDLAIGGSCAARGKGR